MLSRKILIHRLSACRLLRPRWCQFLEASAETFLWLLLSVTICIETFNTDCYFLAFFQRKVLARKIYGTITWLTHPLGVPIVTLILVQCANEVKGIVPLGELNTDISFLTSLLVDQEDSKEPT